MPSAKLILDAAFTIAPVPRRLFGSFVEHMGRCVYTGIYEPGHPTADENGLRSDVLGPDAARSARRWSATPAATSSPTTAGRTASDLASSGRPGSTWPGTRSRPTSSACTSSTTGPRRSDTEVMMAVNLGTRGLREACDLLEYTNHPGGTYWSDRRIANGAKEPFNYKLWCLGNEMDGPWQVGHKTAAEYGRLANETGKAMRLIDSEIELVACGSSNSADAHLRCVGVNRPRARVRHRRLHLAARVLRGEGRRPADLPRLGGQHGHFIEDVVATADAVRARGRHKKRINLSFDEWNVWYIHQFSGDGPKANSEEWVPNPPLIEDEYTVTDAVVVGTFLNSLLRHGDRVTVANQAQLVNVIGLLRSEEGGDAWKQTIAYPFEQMRRLAQGQIVQVVASGDKFDSADVHRRAVRRHQRDL